IADGQVIYGASTSLKALSKSGSLRWSRLLSDYVGAIGAADLDGDGVLDDVVAGTLDGNITAFDSSGVMKWDYWKTFSSSDGRISICPIDADYDGARDEVLFNGIVPIVFTATGAIKFMGSGFVYAKGVSPVDFDGDGILDDVIAGTTNNLYAFNAAGSKLKIDGQDKYNATGAEAIVAVDLDGDGLRNDLIVASDANLAFYGTRFPTPQPISLPLPRPPPPHPLQHPPMTPTATGSATTGRPPWGQTRSPLTLTATG
ncbi:MAG: VCBS repeat-containing protein, partial [Acidobacteria bacterium]|nr:VCBS repeat-containing protein [Acidobacteriota bacterium]